ncbi:MAG: organic hydroperoxide resistance protein [Solirubrobacterales bacterium]
MKVLYTARVTVTGGRNGRGRSDDGKIDLTLTPPPSLGGPSERGEGTNPEELFALGYAACFLSAVEALARRRRIPVTTFSVSSAVSIGREDDRGYALAVDLHANLPGVEDEIARELLRGAHETCPYSKATRGNVEVALFLGDAAV